MPLSCKKIILEHAKHTRSRLKLLLVLLFTIDCAMTANSAALTFILVTCQ